VGRFSDHPRSFEYTAADGGIGSLRRVSLKKQPARGKRRHRRPVAIEKTLERQRSACKKRTPGYQRRSMIRVGRPTCQEIFSSQDCDDGCSGCLRGSAMISGTRVQCAGCERQHRERRTGAVRWWCWPLEKKIFGAIESKTTFAD